MPDAGEFQALTGWLKRHEIAYRKHAPLSDLTTFQLGGPCPILVECHTLSEVSETLMYLSETNTPYLLIGGGSNLVISDQGLPYPVVRFFSDTPEISVSNTELTVSGATLLDDLAAFAAEKGLKELVTCSGIPGTVGGAIAGNAGAFGWQVGDALVRATICDHSGTVTDVEPGSLEFSYRDSRLKYCDDVLLSARFRLTPADPANLKKQREELLALRRDKHPDWHVECCAGSVFRNIDATSKAERRQAAGYFLEESGAKKMSVGGAGVFSKHANIIIKKDASCTAQDVYDLHLMMKKAVKATFDLDLIPEIRFIGEFT